MHHLTRGAVASALVVLVSLLGACSSDDDPDAVETTAPASTPATEEPTEEPSDEPTEEPTEEVSGTVIAVTIADGTVTPAGDRVQVTAGEPITFEIDSDIPGEIHVHSNPEHAIEFEPGTSTHEITIDQPGIVEAELHDPETLVVQLEVR